MSEPSRKYSNKEALKELDDKPGRVVDGIEYKFPKRWAGKVTKRIEKVVQNGFDSGEWSVEITSKSLKDPVKARVNVDREVGTRVQFVLDPTDETGQTAETFFEYVHKFDPVTNDPVGSMEKNEDWDKDGFSDSDYNAE